MRAFLTEPGGVPVGIQEEFEVAFGPEERLHVMAAMKGMFCANLTTNTSRYVARKLRGLDEPEHVEACPIKPRS